ncbi:MAG: phosphoenolpyruvate carboxykinase (ATP) [Campylobacteraceae bacterium]|nr:phosphoenolpyruvate carboxykinase (ATP) [Campylobacteraceae bacterium]
MLSTKQTVENYGIKNAIVHWNLSPEKLTQICVEKNMGKISKSGALMVNTGEFTGRSPLDRFIVKDSITKDKVWWGDINIPFEEDKFDKLYNKVIAHLSNKEIYVRDSYACAAENYRINIRIISELPWSSLFAYNMFLRPTKNELKNFTPEWTVIQAPSFMAVADEDGTRQHNFAILNFSKRIALIGGTGYTGEIKKGIFSALNFILPVEKETLPMHCSANVGDNGETAIFFGLSGTGKTTLSADPNRKLIGDDEHGWDDKGIFNFEGGCYAKCINLKQENEPEIFGAIKRDALLENVVVGSNGVVDYDDGSKTENTRVSYPIYHIKNYKEDSCASHPRKIIFLSADAFGVLPPVSRLTKEQAMYYFMSGYTAKVAGTERGITEPVATFSSCFGEAFLPLHPTVYAKLLGEKIDKHSVEVYLVNTGWSGGTYGVGSRMSLKDTRACINHILSGSINNSEFEKLPIFDLSIPKKLEGIDTNILNPRNSWEDKNEYDKTSEKLANMFIDNFRKYITDESDFSKYGPKL